jgi:hypothetical protein
VAERRHTADREARRVAHLVAACLARVLPELRRVDPPVACAETEDGPACVNEHERLDDLADVRTDCVRRLLCGPRRVGKLPDLDVETQFVQPVLESLSRRVHGP